MFSLEEYSAGCPYLYCAPILFAFHMKLWALERKHTGLKPIECYALLTYYMIAVRVQVFVVDGGDDGQSGSVASRRFMVDKEVSIWLSSIFFVSMIIMLLVAACLRPSPSHDSGSIQPLVDPEEIPAQQEEIPAQQEDGHMA